jgi:KUP system potassium uptake protein
MAARCSTRSCAPTAIDLKSFLEAVFVSPPTRVEGTAVFLTAEPGTVPNALLHNLKHNKVLHEQNLFVTVRNHEVPWIGMDKRWRSSRWATTAGRWWCTTASRTTRPCRARWSRSAAGLRAGADDHQLLPVARHRHSHHRRAAWRMARKAVCADAPQRQRAADFLNLPNNSVVELGSKIEI